jgi:hypothetical protein
MTVTSVPSGPAPTERSRDRKRPRRTVGGRHLGRDASPEAKRLTAAILEVLAGMRTPTDAAAAVGLSLARYYQVESRALTGLLRACEPRGRGPRPSAERDLMALRRHNERLQRELARQHALVRLAQRSVGLAAPVPPASAKGNGKKPRRRRPVSRALQVAARLQTEPVTPPPAPVSLQQPSSPLTP